MKSLSLSSPFLRLLLSLFVLTALAPGWLVADDKPNILIIFTDDQGYGDVGGYGNEKIKTPILDQLAEQGIRFTSFYAQPVCGPSRSALLTGRYPSRSQGWSMPADEITWLLLIRGPQNPDNALDQTLNAWQEQDHNPRGVAIAFSVSCLHGVRRAVN